MKIRPAGLFILFHSSSAWAKDSPDLGLILDAFPLIKLILVLPLLVGLAFLFKAIAFHLTKKRSKTTQQRARTVAMLLPFSVLLYPHVESGYADHLCNTELEYVVNIAPENWTPTLLTKEKAPQQRRQTRDGKNIWWLSTNLREVSHFRERKFHFREWHFALVDSQTGKELERLKYFTDEGGHDFQSCRTKRKFWAMRNLYLAREAVAMGEMEERHFQRKLEESKKWRATPHR